MGVYHNPAPQCFVLACPCLAFQSFLNVEKRRQEQTNDNATIIAKPSQEPKLKERGTSNNKVVLQPSTGPQTRHFQCWFPETSILERKASSSCPCGSENVDPKRPTRSTLLQPGVPQTLPPKAKRKIPKQPKLNKLEARDPINPKQPSLSTQRVLLRTQPGPQTRHFQYYSCNTTQRNPARTPTGPLKLHVFQSRTIQPGPQTRHFQYQSCATTQHNLARTLNEAFPLLKSPRTRNFQY